MLHTSLMKYSNMCFKYESICAILVSKKGWNWLPQFETRCHTCISHFIWSWDQFSPKDNQEVVSFLCCFVLFFWGLQILNQSVLQWVILWFVEVILTCMFIFPFYLPHRCHASRELIFETFYFFWSRSERWRNRSCSLNHS